MKSKKSLVIPSLEDQRIKQLTQKLDEFFQQNNASKENLQDILNQHDQSLSTADGILQLYSKTQNKPTLNRLLDKVVQLLYTDDMTHQTGVFQQDTKQSTMIHHSINRDYPHLFKLLLQFGYAPNSLLTDQKTPLNMAVVNSNITVEQRLEYVRILIDHGADATIADERRVSPFTRICGLESNYPLLYNFFLDHLRQRHPDQLRNEMNNGLVNAIFNRCVPMVADLLQQGARFEELSKAESVTNFIEKIYSTMFRERRSIVGVDPLIDCFILVLRYNHYSSTTGLFVKLIFDEIYIPCVCDPSNSVPTTTPSFEKMKNLLRTACRYRLMKKSQLKDIRTNSLQKILTTPIENYMVTPNIRQTLHDNWSSWLDELEERFMNNPVSLRFSSIQKIRESLTEITPNCVSSLGLNNILVSEILS